MSRLQSPRLSFNSAVRVQRKGTSSSHSTPASVGIFVLKRCSTSPRTDLIIVPEPLIRSVTEGWIPPGSISTISTSPPAIFKNGRISARTSSTPSSVSSAPSADTCSTDTISGILSKRPFSRPYFMVIDEDGHDPHEPCSSRITVAPSMSRSATLPPSAMR
eukprot:CAMPEP_0181186668 /NCGR_PEP_ID=MMETSP1096-20121128/10154_1 /TAXON_ID=156174 ORGANISM="Chrysochromulina ericina, Strain CCMP281" /NCGR_SAMPLE_ID=MMETSP1096 /ASSEMBLY_ACC=CAM_ASM_000453 /LENGTH=160 /DNA_ID=CAMNT_0023275575 /DNA_START=206 /DNA_END=688 /DNA_ORIENTATION=-